MSKPFSLVLDVTANAGTLNDIKNAVTTLVNDVEANEPETIFYRCFTDESTGRICFLDTYANSEAFLTHLNRAPVKAALGMIMEKTTANNLIVFGKVNQAATEAIQGLGGIILPEHAGFDRSQVVAAV